MATHHADDEATISIPSLLFVGILIFFSYRYFFARGDSSSHSSASSAARPGQNGLRFTAAQVEQVSAMFPQLNRRDIMWDLHRNRGSVQATAERVMAGVGLDPVSLVLGSRVCLSCIRVLTEYVLAGAAIIPASDHAHNYEFYAGGWRKSGEEAGG